MALKVIGLAAAALLLSASSVLSGDSRLDPAFRSKPMADTLPDFAKIEIPEFNDWMPFFVNNWIADLNAGEVEKRCEEFVTGNRRGKNGDWVIDNFHSAFSYRFHNLSGDPEQMQSEFSKVQAWIKAAPASKCAPVVLSDLWLSYAWNARGNGYSTSVTPEGWRLFSERIRKSNEVLDQHEHVNKFNPRWFALKVQTVRFLEGNREQELLGWVGQSLVQFPGNYGAAKFASMRYLPEWGGNWGQFESYVESVANLVPGEESDEVYTRLYRNMYLNRRIKAGDDFRAGTKVDWGRFKRGFFGLIKRYPESRDFINGLAAYACRAEDKDTYSRLRPQYRRDDKTTLRDWSVLTLEKCDQLYGGIPG